MSRRRLNFQFIRPLDEIFELWDLQDKIYDLRKAQTRVMQKAKEARLKRAATATAISSFPLEDKLTTSSSPQPSASCDCELPPSSPSSPHQPSMVPLTSAELDNQRAYWAHKALIASSKRGFTAPSSSSSCQTEEVPAQGHELSNTEVQSEPHASPPSMI